MTHRPDTYTDRYLYLLAVAPLLALVLKGWIGWILVISSLISLYLLRREGVQASSASPKRDRAGLWLTLILASLAAPVVGVFMGQAARQEWAWSAYDSPLKFVLAIPIFLWVYRRSVPLVTAWQFTMPAMAIVTALVLPFLPRTGWGDAPTRLGTYFVDPLTFGLTCLTLGLMSLSAINLKGRDTNWLLLLKVLGAIVGIYLSIKSGSRTGWLALPFALLIIVYIQAPTRLRWVSLTAAVTVALAASVASYHVSATVKERTDQAVTEIATYRFNESNEMNSVGARITFTRTAWYLLNLKPWSGWGDKGFKSRLQDPEISRFSTDFTREFAFNAGFHNEFSTNAVRSGIWGVLSTALLFFVPMALFTVALKSDSQRKIAGFALVYMVCTFVGAMTTEVFNLKFTASLHALLIAGLCGTVLAGLRHKDSHEH